jgi:hypothetical protein
VIAAGTYDGQAITNGHVPDFRSTSPHERNSLAEPRLRGIANV